MDNDINLSNVVRKAYLGGRCEVFGNSREEEKVLHFDFSGMYGQCMEENLPYGMMKYQVITNNKIEKEGFYYVEIFYLSRIPILPTKEEKLYFKEG
jgi:hypothetical protein